MATSKITDTNVVETFNMSNIDNMKTPGIYGDSGDFKEYNSAILYVFAAGGRCMQVLIQPYDGIIKARFYTPSGWKSWVTIFDQST